MVARNLACITKNNAGQMSAHKLGIIMHDILSIETERQTQCMKFRVSLPILTLKIYGIQKQTLVLGFNTSPILQRVIFYKYKRHTFRNFSRGQAPIPLFSYKVSFKRALDPICDIQKLLNSTLAYRQQ